MNPPELTEAGVAAWLREEGNDGATYLDTHLMARAVLALVEAKVREAVTIATDEPSPYEEYVSGGKYIETGRAHVDAIASRVMKGPA